ncbi:MAG: hypothetical protein A2003_02095 [Acinetobacter sp. GWC1_38_13]|uniref:hypothetical protein n=1 Tax=Acinetobacter sp. GWC1_38_13 TaxID=1797234 RepID=UPI0008B069EB|nr:hypothetical protein [Acinetobacter sp. GWC1_38_13]OFW46019.1 MAG: hypothetical protein A2003_02095 [Acinetobacter sp. GWC1_38_13]HAV56044.1 hypothetical protein [Acinetobacter junii]
MTTLYTVSFKRTVLATLIGLCLSKYAFALEEISDDALSQTTGEGVAILPTDFSFVLRGDKAGNETSLTDRSKDTGYIHYVPVGGLTSMVQDTNNDGSVTTADHSVGKADLYLYGLALSKNDNDSNNRFGSKIASWGTANNPWVLKAATATDVPDFSGTNGTVTYLNLEAPLYETGTKTGVDAYNLKLALWVDAFVRDQSKPEGDPNQFKLGELFSSTQTADEASAGDRANRLRLQAIANGFGINGSNLQIFQTLGGSSNNNGMSAFYNNTLGVSGVFRINSGDSQNFKAVYNPGTASRTYSIDGGTNYSTTAGWRTATTGCGDDSISFSDANCQFRFRDRKVQDTVSGASWNLPTGFQAGDKVLRISTKETTAQANLSTPALSGTVAPTFEANEGLYLYYPNINLVLGSLYQPLILGSDGRNFSLEIARIPNKPEIYKKIYTDYSGLDNSYLGSTCNVYQCGDSTISGYQGGSARTNYNLANGTKLATHSSISIGTAYSPDGGKTLLAYDGVESMGVFFGQPVSRTEISGTKTYNEVQYQQRRQRVDTSYLVTDRYVLRSEGGLLSDGSTVTDPYDGHTITAGRARTVEEFRWFTTQGYHEDWIYLDSVNADGTKVFGNTDGAYARYCTTAFACLGGTPVNGGSAVAGQKGSVTSPENLNNLTLGGFIAGLDECGPDETGNGMCAGTSQSGEGVKGLSRLTILKSTAAKAENRQWAFGTRNNEARWFNVNGGLEKILYGSANDPAPAVPTGGVNPSAMNNYGSAVIDGLLIQHMKLTTKGL